MEFPSQDQNRNRRRAIQNSNQSQEERDTERQFHERYPANNYRRTSILLSPQQNQTSSSRDRQQQQQERNRNLRYFLARSFQHPSVDIALFYFPLQGVLLNRPEDQQTDPPIDIDNINQNQQADDTELQFQFDRNQSQQKNMVKGEQSSQKFYTKEDWQKRLSAVEVNKEDLNQLVMNFLVTEGYVEAAKVFQQESGTQPETELEQLESRMEIRRSIQKGDIREAIDKLNDFNAEILEEDQMLLFALQQQELIELIRQGKTQEAIIYAQENLAPKGEDNPLYLQDLEKTIALLAFEDVVSSPVRGLLDYGQRYRTAKKLNEAILENQSNEKEARLPQMLKLLVWSQEKLDEKATYPRINDLTSADLEPPIGPPKL